MNEYSGTDIYCDLIIPGTLEVKIVKETPRILAYHHTKPHWPVHIVVTPKTHIASLLELDHELGVELLDIVKTIAREVEEQEGAAVVLTNLGRYQDSKHLHIHVASGAHF